MASFYGFRAKNALAVLVFGAAIWSGSMAWGGDVVWKDVVFSKTIFDEDVKVVLGDIIKLNGQQVIFRQGVKGSITFEFENMPLQAAFNKVMEEQALTSQYDETTNTITISKGEETTDRKVFTPKNSSIAEVASALQRFKVSYEDVKLVQDKATNTIFVQGPTSKTTDVIRLMNDVDVAFLSQKEKIKKDRRNDLERGALDAALSAAISKTDMGIEVVPLYYASVDTTTSTFQGQAVTYPGIIESLKAFVGNLEVRDPAKGVVAGGSGDQLQQLHQAAALQAMEDSKKKEVIQTQYNATMDRPMVSVDRRTNSVLIQGTKEQVAKIKDILKKLDKPVPLIELEVIIVKGSESLSRKFGIDWALDGAAGRNSANGFVDIAGKTQGHLTSADASGAFKLASTLGAPAAGFLYNGTREMLSATLQLSAIDDKSQTLAAPRVVTLNNMAAKITSAKDYNFIVPSVVNGVATSTLVNIPTGLTINIKPSVIDQQPGSARMLRLDINATNSTGTANTSGTVDKSNQEIQTNVIIPENATYVMGGLYSKDRTEVETGVPGLKEIPILGALFRYQTSTDVDSQTTFFITPSIHLPEDIAKNYGGGVRRVVEKGRAKIDKNNTGMECNSQLLGINCVIEEDE